jgi:predicted O-linked N-acetylglucosamine transferase (SPINDLY family)
VILERLVIDFNAGLEAEALAECEAMLAVEEDHPAALYGMALMALRHRAILPALQAILRAHYRDPSEAVYAEVLAVLYAAAGNLAAAAYFSKLSASLGFDADVQALLPPSLPTFPRSLQIIKETPYLHRGDSLLAVRYYTDAIAQYELHLAFFPGHREATRKLALCLLKTEQPARAIACLTELRSEGEATAEDLSLLGQAYAALGEPAAAEACHREAAALDGDSAGIACARLQDAVFDPDRSEPALVELNRAWGTTLAQGGADAERPAATALEGRRVRVGYLASATADPRDLEVLATVASASDPQRFEIYLYGYRSIDEASNALLRGCHDEWRDVSECDAATLAATIEGDGIDILVDIGGHAAPAHLGALALRPARYQVSWLGNPVTLGLPQVDVELASAADTTVHGVRRRPLPYGIYCYDYLGQPPPRPGNRAGAVSFGADLTVAQLHPNLLACWAQVLARVPGSTLALRDRNFVTGGLVERLLELFGAHGIAGRIDVIRTEASSFYREVDVLLAPFVAANPHDVAAALTAGVPVVALAGPGRHRRQASTLLHHVGLDSLVAADVAGYLELAVGLAGSPEARKSATAAIAASLASSPVFDSSQFAVAFDAALLEIAGQTP